MEGDGLIQGFVLDGSGGGKRIGWDAVERWSADQGVLWLHLDRNSEWARQWVRRSGLVDSVTASALLAEETRPRSFPAGEGLLLILRGVNLNPGAEPQDMVGLRLFVDGSKIITVRMRKLMAVSDVADLLDGGKGPQTPADFLSLVTDKLVERMEPVVDSLGAEADEIETDITKWNPTQARQNLRELRTTAIVLRRYLTPQRDLMARLPQEHQPWLSDSARLGFREVADRITRYLEELEEVRERAAVLQDELLNQLSQDANRTVYILTIVASVMLPLSFITGLLGINVGGMPGVDHPWAFWIVCILLAAFGLSQAWLFRRLKWI